MLVGMAGWLQGVTGVEPDRGMMLQFGMLHVVYELVLGAFVGTGLL
jgi:hypothetical protein